MSVTEAPGPQALTAGWRGSAVDLATARAALAGAVSLGKTPAQLDPAIGLRPATAPQATVQPTEKTLAFAQTPLAATVQNPLGVPAWAQGMAQTHSLGPFIDTLGVVTIVPIIPITTSRTFSYAGAVSGFGVLPVTGAPTSATSLTLGPGSVWFLATLLAPAAPVGSFTGFRIAGGTLTASAPLTLESNGYVAPAGATLTLTATLAPPTAASPTSPGADLTAATIALPATVSITFTETAATITALADASVTVYGDKIGISWPTRAASVPAGSPVIIVAGDPSAATFDFASVKSTLFKPSGTAKVSGAGWTLPIAATTITALGEASGAGSLLLELVDGAEATTAITAAIAVRGWAISIDPSQLFVLIGGVGPGSFASYTLWPLSAPSKLHATATWLTPTGIVASFLATPGREIVSVAGGASLFLDRPLAADGGALPIAAPALLAQSLTSAGVQTTIVGVAPASPPPPDFAIALENALIGTRAPHVFLVTGRTTGAKFMRADIALLMDTRWLLPTLPDPYAANFDTAVLLREQGDGAVGTLAAIVAWNGAAAPALGFAIGASAATEILAPPVSPPSLGVVDTTGLALLDLSTRIDLFGVAVYGATAEDAPPPTPAVVDLSLALPDTQVVTFALPQVSWEPMLSVGPEPPLGPVTDSLASDGPATIVRTADAQQTLVAVAPEPVLLQNIANVAAGADFGATFSLPFGLIASISQANRPGSGGGKPLFQGEGGAFGLVRPSFPSALEGAYQLSLVAPDPSAPKAQFSGVTTVSTDGPAPGYGYDVLSSDVATIFQGEFGGGGGAVPIDRVDLSGYGASLFTEWTDTGAKGPSIVKVQFEAIRGRTAYEVVKAQTTMYPYCVPLVRTITIARQNAGWVSRSDSGWVAAAPGKFVFPNTTFTQAIVNRGAITGVYNVRNVVEFETVTVGVAPDVHTYRRATFDADVGIDHRVKVTANGSASSETDAAGNPVTLVPAKGLTGYVQLTPDESASGPPPPNLLPSAAEIAALFAKVGTISNAISCVAEIGYTPSQIGTQLRAAAFEIDMATTGPSAPALGVALRAAPILPKEGAWSFGQRASTGSTPLALPTNFPVPLVQATSDPGNWRFADIADVLQLSSPANVYGLLQDTGTQRTLFEQPFVKDLTGGTPPGTVPGINLPSGVAPVLADLGSLLNATGIFPQLSAAINTFVSGVEEQLQTIKEGLQYRKEYDFKGNEQATTLLDIGILQISLIYADTSAGKDGSGNWKAPTKIVFALDPAHTMPDGAGRDWWFSIQQVSFAVTIPEFGSDPLLTIVGGHNQNGVIVGGFEADNKTKPGLSGLVIDYGSALSTLQSIFSKLQALADFLPGGGGAGLDVSLSDGVLTVQDTFALPTLPLGLGNLSDISLDLGLNITLSPLSAQFIIGIGDADNPFNWVISPLAGNGAIDIGVQNSAPYFMIQGGIGLGLSIDLGIAEGSASITLAVQITVNGSTITIMIILNGQASVDVLGGLASASLSLTAAVGVSIDPLPVPVPTLAPPGISFPAEDITFIASVSVGIHITICWVLSVNFDGSWQFSQGVHTPAISVDA